MRRADLRREAAVIAAKPKSALLYDMILLCGTWHGYAGVLVCVLWWDEPCDGLKNTLWTDFFDWQIQSKNTTFSNESASRIAQSKKVESKKLFFDCVRKPNLGFSRKGPVSV